MYRSKAAYLFLTVCVAALTLLSCPAADGPPGGNGLALGMDLEPKQITFTVDYIEDGNPLDITLPIENKAEDTVTTDFDVHFYLSTDATFDAAAPDVDLGTVNVATDIAGGMTLNINLSLGMPEVVVNQCVYIYAVVDSTDVITENDETNNQSTTNTAAVILLYNGEAAISYNIVFETFWPTGSDTGNNTIMALYDGAGSFLEASDEEDGSGLNESIIRSCSTGTYYVLVQAFIPGGPYAISVRTNNIAIKLFGSDLGSDPYESDDNPQPVYPYGANITPPPASTAIKVGATSNRYAGNPDWDWFEIVLP